MLKGLISVRFNGLKLLDSGFNHWRYGGYRNARCEEKSTVAMSQKIDLLADRIFKEKEL